MGTIQPDTGIMEVRASDIEGLSEEDLPHLLKILLDNSALSMDIPLGCWNVNAHTKAPDGGVDAYIAWKAPSNAVIPPWFQASLQNHFLTIPKSAHDASWRLVHSECGCGQL